MPTLEIAFDPEIARVGPVALGWHGVLTGLAVLVALWLGTRRAHAVVGPVAPLEGVVTWALVGGVVGARLLHVLDHLAAYAADPLAALAVWQGGMAVYGAFLGGLVGGVVAARRAGLPVWLLLDAATPALLVGQAIGRLGCLSNGDAWGAPTGGAWGVVYRHPHARLPAALHGVPTHPYPLYEIGAVLALLLALWWARRWLAAPGAQFLAAAVGYAAIRFGLSYVRQEPGLLAGLQEAQVAALLTRLAALAALAGCMVPRRPLAGKPREG